MADTIEAEFVETPDENVENEANETTETAEATNTNEITPEDLVTLKLNLSIGESEIQVVKANIARNLTNIQEDLQSVTDLMRRLIYNEIEDEQLERIVNSNISWILGIGLSGFKYMNLEKSSMRDLALKMCMDIVIICNSLIANSAN
jgi:hypothetical protein